MNEISKYVDLEKIINDPNKIEINFDNITAININAKEIYKCILKGHYNEHHKILHGNIVLSRIENFNSSNGDFNYVDFKDSNIIDAIFTATSFDYGSVINCNMTNCIFNKCHFHNVSFTGTSFYHTKFENCDLSNMVIESCKFFYCEFINCKTSNKLIELSLLIKCEFNQTDIQLQTIIENFGIERENLINSRIRTLSQNEKFQHIDFSDLKRKVLINDEYNKIEKFKVAYFLDKSIYLEGSEYVDATFELENWLLICEIPSTFINILSIYNEFLSIKFEENEMPLLPIIKLHTLTYLLTNHSKLKPELYNPLMGIHMGLTRYVEDYILVTTTLIESQSQPIVLLVNGSLEIPYYYKELNYIFQDTGLKILKVIKHNSPNELFINWELIKDIIPLISVFVATRIKLEFIKLKDQSINKKNLCKKRVSIQSTRKQNEGIEKFSFELGVDSEKAFLYGIKLKTIFPGSLLLDLRLQFNTTILLKARKIIINILNSNEFKKAS